MTTVQIHQYQVRAGNMVLQPCGKHDIKMKDHLQRLFADQGIQNEIAQQWNVTNLSGLQFHFQIDGQGLTVQNTTNPAQNQSARIALAPAITPVIQTAQKVGTKCMLHRCAQLPQIPPYQPNFNAAKKTTQPTAMPAPQQQAFSPLEIAKSALTMANDMDANGDLRTIFGQLGRWSAQDRDNLFKAYSTLKGTNPMVGQQAFLDHAQVDSWRAEALRKIALKHMQFILSNPATSPQICQAVMDLERLLPNALQLAIQAKMANANAFDLRDWANAIGLYLQEKYGNS